MGSLSTIRDGLKTRLLTITGLRAYDTIPDDINIPCAVVGSPESVEFDSVYARGADKYTIPVRVYATLASERAGQDKLDGYLAGAGSGSIKAAIEGDVTLGGAAHTTRVTRASGYGVYEVAGVSYLGVEFSVEVIG